MRALCPILHFLSLRNRFPGSPSQKPPTGLGKKNHTLNAIQIRPDGGDREASDSHARKIICFCNHILHNESLQSQNFSGRLYNLFTPIQKKGRSETSKLVSLCPHTETSSNWRRPI